jgi:hypothetical protein
MKIYVQAALFTAALVLMTSCTAITRHVAEHSPSNSNSNTTASSTTGVEKVKPAAGTGNVQGKVLYNSKPAENIEVTLCEKFNQFFGGCDGKKYVARTDKDGEYVITNVPPATYEALTARVFDTKYYVFATTGITGLSSEKYEITADKTLFMQPTNLFKSDLKTLNPKAGEKVSADNLELRWAAYPDAAYYKFSLYPEDMSVTSPYVNERVDANSFTIDKPLPKGTYRWQVEAYNDDKVKLAESDRDIKFTIN